MAEYSTAAPPQNPTTNYTATDQLGSPRVITNAVGQVTSRRDFMPFGEELFPDAVYRKTSDKYGAVDSVRQRFTGYQKDTETGLDFAEARYYNNQHARFTAVDPLLASGKSADPQTFNRYVYVLNNPLVLTDPTGLQAGRRVYVSGSEGNLRFRLSSRQPSGYREYNGNRSVNARDGFTYRVTASSLIAVGRWRQSQRMRAAVAPTATSSVPSENPQIRALGAGFQNGLRQVEINTAAAVATVPLILLLPEAAPAAAATIPAATSSVGGPLIGAGVGFGLGYAGAKLVANIGGIGEVPGATNINNEQFQDGSNIPNLVHGDAQNISDIFAPNSVTQITSNRFPVSGIRDWNQFGQGAYTVLESGGQVDLRITTNGGVINPVVDGLNNAGFQNVTATPIGDPNTAWIYRVTGTKPNQ